jgi:hypothetical protein
MIKHILKIIGAQRKANSWIFAELAIAVCAVWWMADQLYVDLRTYYSPMGYDISNAWRFELDFLSPDAPGYVPREEYTSTEASDLVKLQEQIRRHPAVEDVCVASPGAPYSFGNSWTGIVPVDGDTSSLQPYYQVRCVSPEYFDMFRVKDIRGNSITRQLEGQRRPIVLSEDIALQFFRAADVGGRQVRYTGGEERMTITAVCAPYRNNEYVRSEPFFYYIIMPQDMEDFFSGTRAKYAELCVRMKKSFSQEEMNEFLRGMGDRLIVNNLHVYSAVSIAFYREREISEMVNGQSRKLSMALFLLVNVLFGIAGTFWLRGQSRRSEIGLRAALGADKRSIRGSMYLEGLLILFLSAPLTLAFAFNMLYLDVLDTYRLPYTAGRFLVTYGASYLLMAGMICAGVRFPVRKAGKMAPADALRYE